MSVEPEPFVGMETVRHHLGDITRVTVYRYMHDGMPSYSGRSGRRLFKLSEVDAWLFGDELDDSRFKRTEGTAS